MVNEHARNIVSESELRDRLKTSKVSLWNWRKSGMPVESSGIRGKENRYDLDLVLAWLQRTGYGWKSMATAARVGAQRSEGGPKQGAQGNQDDIRLHVRQALGEMFSDGCVAWAGMIAGRYQIAPETALDIVEDGLLVLMTAGARKFGHGDDDFSVPFGDDLVAALSPEFRQGVVDQVKKIAEEYGDFSGKA